MKLKPKTYSKAKARADLPKRTPSSHKTHGGKCLILGGSKGLRGAAILSARAASRSGAGYVYLHPALDGLSVKHPDLLTLKTPRDIHSAIFSAVAIGPGYTDTRKILKLLKSFSKKNYESLVVDAGALDLIPKIKCLKQWILTPHEGELGRMLKVPSRSIREDREHYVQVAQRTFGCVILLKGSKTLVCDEKNLYRIPTGNASLAKAGSGDVLTGMITAFRSQGLSPLHAAALGAYIHGQAADEWIRSKNDVLSLTPIDLIEALPKTIRRLR